MLCSGHGTEFLRHRYNLQARENLYVSYSVDGKQVQKSSGSTNIQDAKRLRDQILGKKARGEIVVSDAAKVTCRELLDDLLAHYEASKPLLSPSITEAAAEQLNAQSAGQLKLTDAHRANLARHRATHGFLREDR